MTNATQDASMSSKDNVIIKLIDLSEKQNDLIFSTRKRIYNLEKIQRRDVFFLLAINFLVCTACILIAVKLGGFQW